MYAGNAMAFDTSLRDAAVHKRRAKWEAERLRVLGELEAALLGAARRAGFSEAYLFGSLTRPGAFRETSDVDVGIPGPLPDVVSVASELSRRVGREVHVIELDESRIGEIARRDGIRWTLPS